MKVHAVSLMVHFKFELFDWKLLHDKYSGAFRGNI